MDDTANLPTPGMEDATVDDLMARHPETMAVFNRFGIDTCCGAHTTVREACERDGVGRTELVAALQQALGRDP